MNLETAFPYCLLSPLLLIHLQKILKTQDKLFQHLNLKNGPEDGNGKLIVINLRRNGCSLLDHLSYSQCQIGVRAHRLLGPLSGNVNGRCIPPTNTETEATWHRAPSSEVRVRRARFKTQFASVWSYSTELLWTSVSWSTLRRWRQTPYNSLRVAVRLTGSNLKALWKMR